MRHPGWNVAQLNVGRLLAPTDSPLVAEFMEALEPVNALADASPGFVWRFQTEDGNATAERPFDDDTILVNFSTWESVEALTDYVYRSVHTEYLRRRREWFARMDEAFTVLWWVPSGHRPTVAEAVGHQKVVDPALLRVARVFAPPLPDDEEPAGASGG